MSLDQTDWWYLRDAAREALFSLAIETGLPIVYRDLCEEGKCLDVDVAGRRVVLQHSSAVTGDFQEDFQRAHKLWPAALKVSYRQQLEQLPPEEP